MIQSASKHSKPVYFTCSFLIEFVLLQVQFKTNISFEQLLLLVQEVSDLLYFTLLGNKLLEMLHTLLHPCLMKP